MEISTGEAGRLQPLIHFSGVVVPAAGSGIRRREEKEWRFKQSASLGVG
jgi:hypothetical protein